MLYRDSFVNAQRRDRMPAWIVDGTPAWVLELVDTFPPHARSRLTPASATPAALGLLKAVADMGKQGLVNVAVAPQVIRWAGWTWRPPTASRPASWTAPREGWEAC